MKKVLLIIIASLGIGVMLQAQVSKTVNLTTAGTLSDSLSTTERNTITTLTLIGNIDARDFTTMRDSMPVLAVIDLSGASIVDYKGTLGPIIDSINDYPAYTIPQYAFCNYNNSSGKNTLTSITFPLSIIAIGDGAFANCNGLISINIPALVTSIGNGAFTACLGLTSVSILATNSFEYGAFYGCSNLQSIYDYSTHPISPFDYNPFDKISVNYTLYVPFGSKNVYQDAWPFIPSANIVEMNGFIPSDSTIFLPSSINNTSITVSSNITWKASSNESWLTVSPNIPTSGTATLSFTATNNTGNGQRTATVTISASGLPSKTVTVTQDVAYTLAVSSNTVFLAKDAGGSATLNVTSNATWMITSPQTWLFVNPTSATNGNGTITVMATANTGDTRVDSIMVSIEGGPMQIIVVTQESSSSTSNLLVSSNTSVLFKF